MAINVIISGGGTGGHIYPAIAIADALKQIDPTVNLLFVGAKGRMEMDTVPKAGYSIKALPIAGFQRGLKLSNVLLPFKLLASLWGAYSIIKAFKPHFVIGTGGYASGPVLKVAQWLKVPTAIQEQNAFAGLTNKWLAAKVARAYVAFDNMNSFFPEKALRLTGNPVRKDISLALEISSAAAKVKFDLDPHKPVLLITGGSLGAFTLNKCMTDNLAAILEQGIQVIWQCGRQGQQRVHATIQKLGFPKGVWAGAFIDKMNEAFAAADIIVSRAGASSISELAIIGKPLVLVPSPNVANDHQRFNAKVLADAGAAILISDNEAEAKLLDTVMQLFKDVNLQQKLSYHMQQFAKTDAAYSIAADVLATVQKGGNSVTA